MNKRRESPVFKNSSNIDRKASGSNWNNNNNTLKDSTNKKESRGNAESEKDLQYGNGSDLLSSTLSSIKTISSEADEVKKSKSARQRDRRRANRNGRIVAMDCEMVGIGENGREDCLARVSIVNRQGEVLLDKYVKPTKEVTDYRTSVSGIRPSDIENGEDFASVQDQVVNLLQGKILVGHAVRNDLGVLHIKHPRSQTRDTSTYKPLCKLVSNGHTPSLKRLSQTILGLEIQKGEHNSVEDARATMNIYNRLSLDWEDYIRAHSRLHPQHQ